MQRIASLVISRSHEGELRSEVGACVAHTVSNDRQVRGSRCEIGNSRYALISLPSGACVEAETRLNVSDRPMKRLRVNEADRVEFDEALLP